MKAENNTARRVLGNYLSVQLQSGLVAMEAALSIQDGELVYEAAQKYLTLAEIAKDFYMDTKLFSSKDRRASHNWGQLLPYLKDYPHAVCKRRHRPARVMGRELVQRGVIHDILQALSGENDLHLDFRQRGEVLTLRCDAGRPIGQRLIIAGQSNPLLAAAREPSINAIKGYLLSRRCMVANIRLHTVGQRVYMHFQVARQLRIPFGT